MTLREAIAAGTSALRGVPELAQNAGRDAELLLLHQLSLSRADLRAYPERESAPDEWKQFEARIARRLRCEPVQYIVGEQEFYGFALKVGPEVLIPRPETELLVESVLAAVPHDTPMRMLDVGTGSGAVAIALAAHLPSATITAVDVSERALSLARVNAETHGVASRIRFLASDLLSAVAGERFDAIVSNPPYVAERDRTQLHPQVRDFEPALALYGGEDGLAVYARLIPAARSALMEGGLLAMEIGYGQQSALAGLLGEWRNVEFRNDLQGIARVVMARR